MKISVLTTAGLSVCWWGSICPVAFLSGMLFAVGAFMLGIVAERLERR